MGADRFLSRWSRLKADHRRARSGEPGTDAPRREDARAPEDPAPGAEPGGTGPARGDAAPAASGPSVASAAQVPAESPPLPPVESLTPGSDFTPFMRGGVDPSTRNAALRRLFSDPAFNVMDGLDVYIDDYGRPDPVPPGMLRALVQSSALGLFDEPGKVRAGAGGDAGPPAPAGAATQAQAGDPPPAANPDDDPASVPPAGAETGESGASGARDAPDG